MPKETTSSFQKVLNDNATTYCTNCRQDLSQELKPLRCSRCRVVHYCSQDCQRANFKFHKSWCKHIHRLREEGESNNGENNNNQPMVLENQYNLAHTIMELAYRSTDTIERGKQIYNLSLLEFYKLMRRDFFFVGAFESVVLLLAFLGYDDHCLALIYFVLNSSEHEIRDFFMMSADDDCNINEWIFGIPGDDRHIMKLSDYDTIRKRIPKNRFCANIILVPLMLIQIRKQARSSSSLSSSSYEETAEIARQVEYSAEYLLPVIMALFPDSRERFGQEEACALFANVDYNVGGDDEDYNYDDKPYQPNRWEQHCYTFWMMLQDCFALTPGMIDVLEGTKDYMLTNFSAGVVSGDINEGPSCADFENFIDHMAKSSQEGYF